MDDYLYGCEDQVNTEAVYLNGRHLCKELQVNMYQRIVLMRVLSVDVQLSNADAQTLGLGSDCYFISPFGVAVATPEGSAMFNVNLSKQLLLGTYVIAHKGVLLDSKKIRFNKEWVEELSEQAGFSPKVIPNGTVGTKCVPAVSFIGTSVNIVKDLMEDILTTQRELLSVIQDAESE